MDRLCSGQHSLMGLLVRIRDSQKLNEVNGFYCHRRNFVDLRLHPSIEFTEIERLSSSILLIDRAHRTLQEALRPDFQEVCRFAVLHAY